MPFVRLRTGGSIQNPPHPVDEGDWHGSNDVGSLPHELARLVVSMGGQIGIVIVLPQRTDNPTLCIVDVILCILKISVHILRGADGLVPTVVDIAVSLIVLLIPGLPVELGVDFLQIAQAVVGIGQHIVVVRKVVIDDRIADFAVRGMVPFLRAEVVEIIDPIAAVGIVAEEFSVGITQAMGAQIDLALVDIVPVIVVLHHSSGLIVDGAVVYIIPSTVEGNQRGSGCMALHCRQEDAQQQYRCQNYCDCPLEVLYKIILSRCDVD